MHSLTPIKTLSVTYFHQNKKSSGFKTVKILRCITAFHLDHFFINAVEAKMLAHVSRHYFFRSSAHNQWQKALNRWCSHILFFFEFCRLLLLLSNIRWILLFTTINGSRIFFMSHSVFPNVVGTGTGKPALATWPPPLTLLYESNCMKSN